jgi:hypothetical protein
MTYDFDVLSRNLLDNFFIKEDQKLIKELRALQALKKAKKDLTDISGIKNDRILSKLLSLNIRPEILSSLTIIPLIKVAWADGSVTETEKKSILEMLDKDSPEYGTVEQWLIRKPDNKLTDAWVAYIQGLCEKLSKEEIKVLKRSLLHRARKVASASGGFFGLFKTSAEEKEMMRKLETVFNDCANLEDQ